MKKIIGASFVLLVISTLLTSCLSNVPAGYRGIRVYLYGQKKGVSEKQLGVGRYWLGVNQKLYTFPVFQQNYVWDGYNAINFQSKEGLDVSGDFGISYSLVPDSVPVIFQKYRRGIEEITNVFLRNMVRDALNNISSRMAIESIYGVHKRDLLMKVDSMVATQTKKYGIIIDRIYTIGELHLPPTIETAITSKLEANQHAQQSQNEVKAVEAEANKKIVRTKADADSKVIEAKAQYDITVMAAKADAEKKVIDTKAQSDAMVLVAKANAESLQIRAQAEGESIKIKAKAQADSVKTVGDSQALVNKKLSQAISKDLIQYHSLDRWDGKLPQISTQNLPFVNLNLPKQ